ncbi:hypothetical protein [Tumebacillus flagellatus]|uniref:Uncharacterized protein n=1 Tax=Tumebacillus flagellatus TaxID=1157490 RepID=A0A074LSN9_9BACL|nr:hypothetical protein [Tumebacillus flagellatus]KEO85146.1 hypothetical protein EL26_00900 [Tumebacillus flagellatus]
MSEQQPPRQEIQQEPLQKLPTPQDLQHEGLDPAALHELFFMQPDNGPLLPAQMVKRALFPRWEVIVPAEFNPVDEEDRMIGNLLHEAAADQKHPGPH